MKKLVTLMAIAVSFGILTPAAVQARDSHGHSSGRSISHTCRSCGDAVYRERIVVGHDRHGHPRYDYRTLSHRCRADSGHGGGHGSSHGRGDREHISGPGFHLDFGARSGRH